MMPANYQPSQGQMGNYRCAPTTLQLFFIQYYQVKATPRLVGDGPSYVRSLSLYSQYRCVCCLIFLARPWHTSLIIWQKIYQNKIIFSISFFLVPMTLYLSCYHLFSCLFFSLCSPPAKSTKFDFSLRGGGSLVDDDYSDDEYEPASMWELPSPHFRGPSRPQATSPVRHQSQNHYCCIVSQIVKALQKCYDLISRYFGDLRKWIDLICPLFF